jgi:hypothetical protein
MCVCVQGWENEYGLLRRSTLKGLSGICQLALEAFPIYFSFTLFGTGVCVSVCVFSTMQTYGLYFTLHTAPHTHAHNTHFIPPHTHIHTHTHTQALPCTHPRATGSRALVRPRSLSLVYSTATASRYVCVCVCVCVCTIFSVLNFHSHYTHTHVGGLRRS